MHPDLFVDPFTPHVTQENAAEPTRSVPPKRAPLIDDANRWMR